MDKKEANFVGLGAMGAGLLFLFKEAVSWALDKALDLLPFKKLPNGNTDMSAVPWADIIGVALILIGLIVLIRGQFADRKITKTENLPAPPMTELQAKQLLDWAWSFRAEWEDAKARFPNEAAKVAAALDGITDKVNGQLEAYANYQRSIYQDALRAAAGDLNMVAKITAQILEDSIVSRNTEAAVKLDQAFSEMSYILHRLDAAASQLTQFVESQSPGGIESETPL